MGGGEGESTAGKDTHVSVTCKNSVYMCLKLTSSLTLRSDGRRGDMRDDSAEILLQGFQQEALVGSLALAGMSTLSCCPFSISSSDHGVANPPRCPEGLFWRGCRGVAWVKGLFFFFFLQNR